MSVLGSVAVTLAVAHTAATLLLCRRARRGSPRGGAVSEWALVLALAAGSAAALHGRWLSVDALLLMAVVPLVCLMARPLTGALHSAGRIAVPVSVAAHLALLAWCASAVATGEEPGWRARP